MGEIEDFYLVIKASLHMASKCLVTGYHPYYVYRIKTYCCLPVPPFDTSRTLMGGCAVALSPYSKDHLVVGIVVTRSGRESGKLQGDEKK